MAELPLHERIIESIKSGKLGFNLQVYEGETWDGYGQLYPHLLVEVPLKPECGTVCCIAGHLAHTLPAKDRGPALDYDMLAMDLWAEAYPHANMVIFMAGIRSPCNWPTLTPSLLQVTHFLKFCTGLYDEQGWVREVPAERVEEGGWFEAKETIARICAHATESNVETTA